jgi:predicted transglutaminase-like cysteine proteinase
MGWRFKQTLQIHCALVIAGAAILAVAAGAAVAGERTASLGRYSVPGRAGFVAVGDPTRPPIGWVEFCIGRRAECATRPSTPRDIVLTAKAWTDLVKVNTWVNDSVQPVTDLEHWGVVERWSYPDDGKGDCEDYVLLKRRMLMQAGWPREALLITVVRQKNGEGHAVLTVKTDKGEFILDNLEAQILPWTETGYRYIKRQSQSDPNVWIAIGEPSRNAPATATAR